MDEQQLGKCHRCAHYRAFKNYYFCDVGESNTARCIRENGSWYAPRNTMFDIPQMKILEIGPVPEPETEEVPNA